MGNKELLDLFKNHVKARHAYGPQGHRGISILIYPESPTGYYDAQRLDKHFKDARRGRDDWNSQGKFLFQPGGDRLLYGYMAAPEDLDMFNKHIKGEENNKVVDLQGQVQREMEASKTLKKSTSQMMNKLHMREDELKVIRERAREQYKQQDGGRSQGLNKFHFILYGSSLFLLAPPAKRAGIAWLSRKAPACNS